MAGLLITVLFGAVCIGVALLISYLAGDFSLSVSDSPLGSTESIEDALVTAGYQAAASQSPEKASKKVVKLGVRREAGYLYYIDKSGDISRAKMARGGHSGGKPAKVVKVGIKKEPGFLYFLDKQGDVSMRQVEAEEAHK